ncbi:MAG: hypothetical protein R2856_12495 [Caldilineaceae bacterium]
MDLLASVTDADLPGVIGNSGHDLEKLLEVMDQIDDLAPYDSLCLHH